MLQPKRTKYRKVHKGRNEGLRASQRAALTWHSANTA